MPKAAIFDLDGTLLDLVDLHASAWHHAFKKHGYDVSFQQARSQIGKGGDKLMPTFLSKDAMREHGEQLETWRSDFFKKTYLPLIRPFSAVPELLQKCREAGLTIAIASSAKKDEVEKYLAIAAITKLVDVVVSSEDVDESKPEPDVFQAVLGKLAIDGSDAVAIGDSPYDALAAGKAGTGTIGVLCGGFPESELRQAGCAEIYPGPAALLALFETLRLGK